MASKNNPAWVIYGLRLADSNDYIYIGRTARAIRTRIRDHIFYANREVKKQPVHRWLAKHQHEYTYDILERCPEGNWDYLDEREVHWITSMKDAGAKLLNCDNGGMGGRGRKHTDETKLFLSERVQGSKNPNYIDGRSKVKIRKVRINKGPTGPKSEEHKDKLRLAAHRRWHIDRDIINADCRFCTN